MIPRCEVSEREVSLNVKIKDVEKVLDKDYFVCGSADKALNKLKRILDELKDNE